MGSSSRDCILAAIRQSQNKQPAPGGEFADRLKVHARGPLPQVGDDLEAAFIDRLQAAAATVAHASSADELGEEVVRWLQLQGADLQLVRSTSPLLNNVSWPKTVDVRNAADGMDQSTTLTEAYCAIAETGSLVKLSSQESPTALNFLPDNFICVIQRGRIVRHIEDVWDLVRTETADMPRALNIITGPSRTADVEQTIQLGAHGPRRMHVILYS